MARLITVFLSLVLMGATLLLASPSSMGAQEATPGAGGTSPSSALEVVAGGLTNPRGFTWGEDGALYVALSGNGGMATDPQQAAPDATPDLAAEGDVLVADDSGAVVRIVDGCPVDVAAGFPSYNFLPLNWTGGVIDVAFLDGALYALVDGGGDFNLHPDEPNGVYRIADDGGAELVADLSAWFRANPVAEPTGEINPDGQPYGMIPGDGVLWISESNHEQLLTVAPDGAITRVADLSPRAVLDGAVPTGLAAAPDGGVYLGLLTEMPYPDGAAKVVHVAADGAVTDVWTGLTAITDIALGPDGALYASELSTGNTDTEPFYRPHSGRIVRQTGPDAHEVIAAGLDYPVHIGFGPDGGLHVASPAFGANGGEGAILRVDPASQAAATPATERPCLVGPVAIEFLWASSGGPEPLENPYGVGVAPDGNVWVADGFNGRFQILAPDGTFVETWGEPGSGAGQFDFETVFGGAVIGLGDVAWDAAGAIYVVDTGNRRVQKFGPDRSFLLAWGGQGEDDGEFLKPNSIAVDATGIVYVSDEGRADVQRFDGEGRFLGTIGERGSADGQFATPVAVAVDDAGDVWVADWSRHRVQRFSSEGELLDAWGDIGGKDGELTGPNDLAFDDGGRVYVWDDRNFRIAVFTRDGEFLSATKGYGLEPGQFLSGAGLDHGDGVLYVSDMGRNDVQAFRVVPKNE